MSILPDRILNKIVESDRRYLGRSGVTAADALHHETAKLERDIHNQFSSWCKRNRIKVWHSNPVRKSSIFEGAPDFLCVRGGLAFAIEFKVYPNKLSDVQRREITELLDDGTPVAVCIESQGHSAYAEATEIVSKYFGMMDAS